MQERRAEIRRQLRRAIAAFVVVTLVGAGGYFLIGRNRAWSDEPWTVLDALYMAVTTASTVGFREVHEPGPVGRVFTIVFILIGVGAFMYVATTVASYVIAGELQGFWSQRRMERKIAELADHFILCGYGRMGREVAIDFKRNRRALIIIDHSEDALRLATEQGYLVVHGDSGDDETLKRAGVQRARGLVSCIEDDAGNLMTVLSARALNAKLFIVARVVNDRNVSKLTAAGANRVLWPYGLAARRMAQMVLRPNVVEFLEFVMHDEELELWLEEVQIAIGAVLEGAAIGSAEVRGKTGAMLVAIRQRTGKMLVAPSAETVLSAGDIAVALGTREQLQRLREMASGKQAAAGTANSR